MAYTWNLSFARVMLVFTWIITPSREVLSLSTLSLLTGSCNIVAQPKLLQDNVRCEEFAPHVFVVFGSVVLCPIVCIIKFPRTPIESELFLAFSVSEPVESHVHGFGSLRLYFAVDHPFGH